MKASPVYFWQKAPFVKILIPTIGGILLQWYFPSTRHAWIIILINSLALLCAFFFAPFFQRLRFSFLGGIITSLIFFSVGAMLVCKQDIRHQPRWLGHVYEPENILAATLEEPLVEKARSYKANAAIDGYIDHNSVFKAHARIIVYFANEGPPDSSLNYGTRILFKKPLQEIKNTGNPGAFDYKRYALFQGITHQVFLKPGEFEILDQKNENAFKKSLYTSREKILQVIRKYIPGEQESGLAEALLVGYKHDLDPSLMQSYTNTGVVHIIAISGLHLGLIYWLLGMLLRPLQKNKKTRWMRAFLIIASLWLFSFLAGAQPSILRSALMFTCIVLGESLSRKTSIYNTMAASAFILLCIDPFWIWDVGFQLSYAAVLSIVIFMQPVYNLLYIKNKWLDLAWKMNAVTLAAQVLTIPLCIYHFHQFPNLFLLTNFLAVPLSSLILLGEIFLCIISFIPDIAAFWGKILGWLIHLMNTWIRKIESLPYSLWEGLQISVAQAILLYLFIAMITLWVFEARPKALRWALLALLFFAVLRSGAFLKAQHQRKIIVYNVPQKQAVDFINGRNYFFRGDSSVETNELTKNFHFRSSRILQRVTHSDQLRSLHLHPMSINFHGKNIVLLDKTIFFDSTSGRPKIDLLVISRNPKLYFHQLAKVMDIKQVVFDGSVPQWKMQYWKKDCDSLSIPWHDVSMKGAFVMNLP